MRDWTLRATGRVALAPFLFLLPWLLLLASLSAQGAEPRVFAVARLPFSLPIYVAQAKGYLVKEGVALKIVDCVIGRQCLDQLLTGQADLATVADFPMVMASLQGAEFAVLATLATAQNNNKVVTRRDSGIAAITDLPGRRVGTMVGTSAQYFLDLSLMFAEIDPARVAVVPLDPAEAPAALSRGTLDAVALFEPYAFEAARQLGTNARVLPSLRARRVNWNLVGSDEALHPDDGTVQGLLRALVRANEFIADHPAAAREILQHRLGLNDEAVAWVWDDHEFRLQLSQSLITSLEGQARWAIRRGYAKGPAPNYLQYMRKGPLASVLPGAVTLAQ